MSLEQELVSRYESVLQADRMNPYYTSKAEWKKDIVIKILELKRIINKDKN